MFGGREWEDACSRVFYAKEWEQRSAVSCIHDGSCIINDIYIICTALKSQHQGALNPCWLLCADGYDAVVMRYRRYTAVLCSGLGALHYRGADLQNHVHQGSSHPHGDRGWVGEPRKRHSRDSPSSAVPSWFECQLAMTPPLTGSQDAAVASLDSTHGRCCNQTCAETPSRDRPPLEQLLGYRMPVRHLGMSAQRSTAQQL